MMVLSSTGRTMGVILGLLGYFLVHQQQIALVHAQHHMDPSRQRRNLRQNNAKEAMRLRGDRREESKSLERNLVQQCSNVELEIQFDNFAQEVYWDLHNEYYSVAYYSDYYDASNNNAIVNRNICIPPGSYNFTIYDGGDDGLCCGSGQGYYKLSVSGVLIKQGGVYEEQELTTFDVVGPPTVSPSPTPEPSPWPTAAPSLAPTVSCAANEVTMAVEIKSDSYDDISWNMTDALHTLVMAEVEYLYVTPYATVYREYCIARGAYRFTIYSAYGHALDNGQYSVYLDGVSTIEGGAFLDSESKTFATQGATVWPTVSPQPSASPTVSPQPTPLWTSWPIFLDTFSPTSTPTSAPTVQCASDEVVFALDLKLDSTAISWQVTDSAGSVLLSGLGYTYEQWKVHKELCLPAGSYTFTIYDTEGDGMPWGYYKLWMDGTLVKKGGAFGSQESTALVSAPDNNI